MSVVSLPDPLPQPVRRTSARRFDRSTLSVRKPSALPAEIAFLTAFGVAPGVLFRAAEVARNLDVSADVALLASGGVSEALFYRCLARRLGVTFLQAEMTIVLQLPPAQAIAAGIATLAANPSGLTRVVAPRGRAIGMLLDARRQDDRSLLPIVLATPRQFAGLVRAAAARQIVMSATKKPPLDDASLSASTGLTRWQAAVAAASSFALAFALVVEPAVVACALWLLFLWAIVTRLAAVAASSAQGWRAADGGPHDAELPIYTVLVPLYREARMAKRLVEALDRLDYPHARLDIKLLVEANDKATSDALVALSLPARYEILTAPRGLPQTKPRALNIGLGFARGSLVVVFDAEDDPDPDQLRAAAACFAQAPERVACLQAKLAIHNTGDGWLARLFAVEYCALFDVLNPGFAALGLPILLGGTSNHFRTDALRKAGGWDAWNVTEDADLGIRLARCGYDVRMLDSTTREEAPDNVMIWLKQRSRWLKGWMQTLVVHTRSPRRLIRELGWLHAFSSIALLGGTLLGALIGPIFTAAVLWRIFAGDFLHPASLREAITTSVASSVLFLGLVSAAAPIVLGITRRGRDDLWPTLLLLPAYYALLSGAAWMALVEVVHWPHRWRKTEHGLGKSARLPPSDQTRHTRSLGQAAIP